MANVGITFAPTSDYSQQKPTQGGGASPVQDAIRILSFRMPTVLGAGAVSPMQNLGAPSPFGSSIGAAVIQNWLKQLLGGTGGGEGSSYGNIFGNDGASGVPPMPDIGGGLPPSIILNQPRPQMPSGGGMPSLPEEPPNPFPGNQGGVGGGGRAY